MREIVYFTILAKSEYRAKVTNHSAACVLSQRSGPPSVKARPDASPNRVAERYIRPILADIINVYNDLLIIQELCRPDYGQR